MIGYNLNLTSCRRSISALRAAASAFASSNLCSSIWANILIPASDGSIACPSSRFKTLMYCLSTQKFKPRVISASSKRCFVFSKPKTCEAGRHFSQSGSRCLSSSRTSRIQIAIFSIDGGMRSNRAMCGRRITCHTFIRRRRRALQPRVACSSNVRPLSRQSSR